MSSGRCTPEEDLEDISSEEDFSGSDTDDSDGEEGADGAVFDVRLMFMRY